MKFTSFIALWCLFEWPHLALNICQIAEGTFLQNKPSHGLQFNDPLVAECAPIIN